MMPIKIGHICYANCTPIFSALTSGFGCSGYEFVRGVPAILNMMLRQGQIDVCPSSSIEYAKSPGEYLIIPGLSISSIGPVKSVLLFSRCPIEELDGQPVGLSTESNTSVNLLKILLCRMYGFRNSFHAAPDPLKESLENFSAVLLIGDRALQGAEEMKGVYIYDLGELWYRFSGLPFVFALWLARADRVEEKGNDFLLLGSRLLAAKEKAYQEYDLIASASAERDWIDDRKLVEYWQTISYDLTPAHIRGVTEFFRHATELGLVQKVGELRFLE